MASDVGRPEGGAGRALAPPEERAPEALRVGSSAIGTDEWAAQAGVRTEGYRGRTAPLRRGWDRVPPVARLALFVAAVAAVPLLTDSGFVVRVAVNALVLGLLALGLNVVVGSAGLLDLGYVAFFGVGAYGYALLSSGQFDLHWPGEAAIAVVVVATALLGLLLGLPSRRLLGDYLAIVTLFFGQVFVELALNLDRITPPWSDRPLNVTGGPNGIAGVDPLRLLGFELAEVEHYLYLLLAVVVVVVVVLHRLDRSRTGRAWRALREDPLAAELLGIPVNRLKLFAFAAGGAIAGLAGTLFAAVQVGVFPQNFEVTLLIMVYAAVILGGAGSLAGVLLGAGVIAVVPEVLRDPANGRVVFYGLVVAALLAKVRPWPRLAAVLAATALFGFAVRTVAKAAWPEGADGAVEGTGALARAVDAWVVVPKDAEVLGNWAFVALVVAGVALTRLRGPVRHVALVPVLYLAAFVWEARLVGQPSVTRQLVVGGILVVMMNARPQGLLGTPRVEVA